MSRVSKNAIDKVGSLYMTGINEQITSHFRTLMELKLEQAEAVTATFFCLLRKDVKKGSGSARRSWFPYSISISPSSVQSAR